MRSPRLSRSARERQRRHVAVLSLGAFPVATTDTEIDSPRRDGDFERSFTVLFASAEARTERGYPELMTPFYESVRSSLSLLLERGANLAVNVPTEVESTHVRAHRRSGANHAAHDSPRYPKPIERRETTS
jgi:hypothetical protein